MTERIDHTAEARSFLAYSADLNPQMDGERSQHATALAQVHATLALVEQQRIANRIALAEHAQRHYGNYAGEAGGMGTLFSYGYTPEGNIRIRVDIREGLGL